MKKIGQERQSIQQPAEMTTAIAPSAHQVVASGATDVMSLQITNQYAYAAYNSFPIQTCTNFLPHGDPAMGSDFDSSPFCSQGKSTYNHLLHHDPWERWQNPVNLPANPGLDGQPKLLAALSPRVFESQSSMNRSGHVSRLSYPPMQPYVGQLHGGDPRQGSLNHTPYSPTEVHHCHWLRGDNVPCEFAGSQDLLKGHIISEHLSQEAQVVCRWQGCQYSRRGKPEVRTMRRDSAWRHVREMHLDVKFRKKVKAL